MSYAEPVGPVGVAVDARSPTRRRRKRHAPLGKMQVLGDLAACIGSADHEHVALGLRS